ncbi:hypothetical protein ZOSMA_56G01050 [Zostera marina]|uniref:Uncharacterized protein n=1 Tax=Zostera marina TaxID=29655 RepID=A0A0K9NVT6_ZOSMR|nr:hypothetical protein ZOSMA_56G01050 [Zostera marina]
MAIKLEQPAILFILMLFPFLSSTTTINTTSLTAYEVMETYNFPIGLLPEGCLGYDLDRSTGKFAAYLDGECQFSLEGSYDLKYDSTISGYISEGKLSSLQGVSVKILFFWINIIEVTREGDNLKFSVGIASASFPIYNFFICPKCGCGVDCVNGGKKGTGMKLRSEI